MFKTIISFMLISFVSTFAQTYSGTYSARNSSNGTNITLKLNQGSSGNISGVLVLNNRETYKVEGKQENYYGESALTGTIRNGNDLSFFEAYLENNQLGFTWIPSDNNNQPNYDSAIDVVFNKTGSNDNYKEKGQNKMYENNYKNQTGRNKESKNNYQRDPAIVGLWHYTKSYTSGDFSMVTEKYMEVRPDGSYSYGNGRAVGGGNSGSFDSGNSDDDVITGKWRTENGIIYIDEGGYGNWAPYAGYYVEGNRLLIKFDDGSKELWYRQ